MKLIIPIRDLQLDGLVSKLNVNAAIYIVYIKKLLVEKNTQISSDTATKDLTLDQVLLYMLHDFNESYMKFNKVPPGIDKTIVLIHQILECNNEERIRLMSGNIFKDNVAIAMAQVDSVKSEFNYVKAGLKIIAAIAIFLATLAILFVAGMALGLMANVVGGSMWFSAAYGAVAESAWWFGTAGLSTVLASIGPLALIKDAINQIKRTRQVNESVPSVNGFSLFKDMSFKTEESISSLQNSRATTLPQNELMIHSLL